ncbi:MAG: 50S ribosomal protein L9 [Patescibacteria group bacterium]|jgi:large subunit ribosomal protein L9
MKLILIENVAKLGVAGDGVDVADGFARNYLIPKNLAVMPEDSRAREILNKLEMKKEKNEKEKIEMGKIVAEIDGKKIVITAKANKNKLFAAINKDQIATELQGVKPETIVLEEPIKELGDYKIRLDFGSGLNAFVNLEVKSEK